LMTSSDDLIIDRLEIYPNPFNSFIAATFHDSPVAMILFNQMGRIISQGGNRLEDLIELPAGIYFLQIHAGHNLFVKKVVKVD
jgi:hypothetical protein